MTPEEIELERRAQDIMLSVIKQMERLNAGQSVLADRTKDNAEEVRRLADAIQAKAEAEMATAKAAQAKLDADADSERMAMEMSWPAVLKTKVYKSKVTAREAVLAIGYVVTGVGTIIALLTGAAKIPELDAMLESVQEVEAPAAPAAPGGEHEP